MPIGMLFLESEALSQSKQSHEKVRWYPQICGRLLPSRSGEHLALISQNLAIEHSNQSCFLNAKRVSSPSNHNHALFPDHPFDVSASSVDEKASTSHSWSSNPHEHPRHLNFGSI